MDVPGARPRGLVCPGLRCPVPAVDHRRRIRPVPVYPVACPAPAGVLVVAGAAQVVRVGCGDTAAPDAAAAADVAFVKPLRERNVLLRGPAHNKRRITSTERELLAQPQRRG